MLGFGLGLNKWRRVGGGFVGLLDLFPNAAAAYSLRLLRKDYSGGLVRARAWDGSANQGEADVMAYRVSATEYVLDLNSTLENLDATAISRGLTTSDTLADLVSTGVNDYDGLTSAWYDQSLSNDATQSTAAAQPKIVSAGSLVTENGKAAIDFDGTDDYLLSGQIDFDNEFIVATTKASGSGRLINARYNGNNILMMSNGRYRRDTNDLLFNGPLYNINLNQQTLFSGIDQNTLYQDSVLITAKDNAGYTLGSNDGVFIAIRADISNPLDCSFQEIILYTSSQSANRTAIETNINNFYSIYP